MKSFVLSALLGLTASALRVGVISDMHTLEAYDPTASADNDCLASNSSLSASESAPLARFDCDPSPTLVDYMVTRFKEKFGEVDLLLAPGDFISHAVSVHRDEFQPSDVDAYKQNFRVSTGVLSKHFPDTVTVMSIGNNDGYHSQGPAEDEKATLYGFLHDLWFVNYPGNQAIADSVKDTFMDAGYYRVDVTDKISVLAFNNNYMDIDDDSSVHSDWASAQLAWMENQLIAGAAEGRKFILTGHQYAGARYHANDLWHSDEARRYFQILRDNHDAVIIEVMGHDHYAGMRYHSSWNVLDFPDTDEKFDFHNILVSPGVTPNKGNNPGVAMFEVSDDGVPSNLRYEFIDIVPQQGASSVSYSDLKFLSLAMSDYGVNELTGQSIAAFRKALEADQDMALEYLVRLMGFDATDDAEVEMAYAVYEDKDLITSSKHKTGEYICLMHKSLSSAEIQDCFDSANSLGEDFLPRSFLQ